MNPRSEAIAILQQAREILSQRLTERIVEGQEEIISDAEAGSFVSEIEAIYEQVGSRLAHINTMLANLPPVDEAVPEQPPVETVYTDVAVYGSESAGGPAPAGPLALPAPTAPVPRLPRMGATFQLFAAQIEAGDMDGATVSLAELFGLDAVRSRQCAETFVRKLADDPELLLKAMRLRMELAGGSVNAALMLLWDCFGLAGVESLGVYRTLCARVEDNDATEPGVS